MNNNTISGIKQPTYTEFQLIKALDDWIFQSYGITQPVHQRIIRYWARRINNNPKMKRQIRQGETVGVKDVTTAEKVECSTKVVAECRRLAKKSGLLTYQRRQIGVWVMFFDCMVKQKPAEIVDNKGVISGVFDQTENDLTESSQVPQSTLSQVHLSEVSEAPNADSDSVTEIEDEIVQEQVYKNKTNTTTIELRDTITDHANDESVVVVEDEKELIKEPTMSTRQQMALFQAWKLNRIRHKREISKRKMIEIDENTKVTQYQQHYEQIAEVVEWAIEQKYCTKDDATLKLRPIFDSATKQFSVPIGLIRSDEGRQVFKDAFAEPADRNHNLSPSDPGYYNEEAQAETRNRHKEKSRQVREKGAAYGFSDERSERTEKIKQKADQVHQRSKLEPEPVTEPEQVEETKSNGNGGGGSMSPSERKAWLREQVPALNNVQSTTKSKFSSASDVVEETKKKIREKSQMELFDWSGLDKE